MNSTRRRTFIVAPMLVAWAALAGLSAPGCGGEGATAGNAATPPPPVAAPPPAAPPPATPAPSVAASVAPPPPTPNPQGAEVTEAQDHRENHHAGTLPLILMSLKEVDLTADQQASIDKIRADLLAKMDPAREAEKDFAYLLADGVAAGSVDHAKADTAIGKLVTQVQGLHDASLTALNQIHAVLNAQQRVKLVDAIQGHWEKWKEAHGHDEQDDPQHRSGYLLALVAHLGLSQEQADKIKANFHEKMKASPQDHMHKEVQDHLQAFATAFKADAFDAKKLTGAKAANGHIAKWGATRRARFYEAAAPVLTPEQRAKLAQVIRDHAGKSES
jgi:Spy/CpxP family protein refolding chaperone